MSMCDNMSVGLCIICLHLATMHCGWVLWCTADKVSLVLYSIWNKSTAAHFWWLQQHHTRGKVLKYMWCMLHNDQCCGWRCIALVSASTASVRIEHLLASSGYTLRDTLACPVCLFVTHWNCTKLLRRHTCRVNIRWYLELQYAADARVRHRETITVEMSLGIREAAVTGLSSTIGLGTECHGGCYALCHMCHAIYPCVSPSHAAVTPCCITLFTSYPLSYAPHYHFMTFRECVFVLLLIFVSMQYNL